MYQVSNAYKQKIDSGAMQFDVYGTIGATSITASNIMSLSITNQCSSESEVRIGQVYVGQLNMTIAGMNFTIRSLIGQPVILYAGVLTFVPRMVLSDGNGRVLANEHDAVIAVTKRNIHDYVPLGIYYIDSAMRTQTGIEIVAYDAMAKFDVNVPSMLNGTPYQILSACCSACGVTLGMTPAQIQALPNGNYSATCYGTNDITVYRDVISWIAQMMGCYATIDRAEHLVLRTYKMIADEVIDSTHRYMGGSFSDYVTFYTAMVLTDIESNTDTRYARSTDNGLTYTLGSNPYLQTFANASVKSTVLNTLLNAITSFQYVPFTAELPPDPKYDLGDVISFTGGIADATVRYCITKFDWSYNNKNALSGTGRNAAYKDQISSPTKQIALLSNNIEAVANTARKNLENAISIVEQDMATAVQKVTGNLGGYVILYDSDSDGYPDEILIMNTPDIDTATSVWRFNQQGLMWADSYTGTYSTIALTNDGKIVADAITTGTLRGISIISEDSDRNTITLSAGKLITKEYSSSRQTVTTAYGYNVQSPNHITTGTLSNSIGSVNIGVLRLDKELVNSWIEVDPNGYSIMDEGKLVANLLVAMNGTYHRIGRNILTTGGTQVLLGELGNGGILTLYDENGVREAVLGKESIAGTLSKPRLAFYEPSGSTYVQRSAFGIDFAIINDGTNVGYVAYGKTNAYKYVLNYVSGRLDIYNNTTLLGYVTLTGSSDRNVKTDIEEISEAVKEAIRSVELTQFKYNFTDASRQEANQRTNYGAIAQDVIEALREKGIDYRDTWFIEETSDDNGDLYNINYTQFLLARLAADEDKIKSLEERIAALEARLEAN